MTIYVQNKATVFHFSEDIHKNSISKALFALRASGSPYPSHKDVSSDEESLYNWLLSDETIHRFVAIVNNEVAGHISLTKPHSYLTEYLEKAGVRSASSKGFLEISKFFVSPEFQKCGVGGSLFRSAIDIVSSLGYSPALAVVDTSVDAISFYGHHGLKEIGSFEGFHGKNFIFI